MTQTFEQVFNQIKNLENANNQKLNKAKQDSKTTIHILSEQKNTERIEKIKKINFEIDNFYKEEKQKLNENINSKKLEIERQILDLKAGFENKTSVAINELFSDFFTK